MVLYTWKIGKLNVDEFNVFIFDMLDDIRNGFETQGNSSFWVQLCSRDSHYTD